MSPEQKPNPDFEQRLLIRLKAVVAERGATAAARRPRGRRPQHHPGAGADRAWPWAV